MVDTKAVATVTAETSRYLAVLANPDISPMELLRENVGDGGLSRFDLTRIKIPTGGGKFWELPALEGPQMVQSIEGIICWWTPMRSYWPQKFGEGASTNEPPQCSSADGVVGVGDPGIECANCPFNEWGSADGGQARGKACKEIRALFMLLEGQMLPVFVGASPMSLAPMKQYSLALASSGLFYHGVVTRLELEQAKNADGISYSKIRPSMSRRLLPEEIAALAPYKDALQAALRGQQLMTQDMDG